MPNWCSNIVVFACSKTTERKLKKFFADLAKKEDKEQHGQLPEFFDSDTGFMFEIRWEDGVLYYETKWGPNPDVMVAIAEHFRTDFRLEYQELNMQIYGEFSFIKGVPNDVCLGENDLALYDLNPDEEDTWIFEGKIYDSDIEILDILLQRKKLRDRE